MAAVRASMTFIGTICLQFLLSQYGTYWAFSWDIIEPITACVSLADGIAAYFFWLWAGKPWDLNDIRSFFFQRKLEKALSKKSINYQTYLTMKRIREEYKAQLFNRRQNF